MENRYRVGERAFFFLYPPGRIGLTSTVGGRAGKLQVTGGQVTLPPDWPELEVLAKVDTTNAVDPAPHGTRVPAEWLAQRIQQTDVASRKRSSP